VLSTVDTHAQEATILTTNRHNDTLFTLLMKNHEVFMETRQLFFQIFIGNDFPMDLNATAVNFLVPLYA
jgi:hypothetical protein